MKKIFFIMAISLSIKATAQKGAFFLINPAINLLSTEGKSTSKFGGQVSVGYCSAKNIGAGLSIDYIDKTAATVGIDMRGFFPVNKYTISPAVGIGKALAVKQPANTEGNMSYGGSLSVFCPFSKSADISFIAGFKVITFKVNKSATVNMNDLYFGFGVKF